MLISICRLSDGCAVVSGIELTAALTNVSCASVEVHGIISVTDSVMVQRSVRLIGVTTDAAIIQSNSNKNCLYIRDVTTGVFVTGLRLDASNAQAALVVANASNVYVSSVHIDGPPHIFAVFYAGADVAAHEATLSNYASRTGMDTNNTLVNSTVNSTWSGDSLSFSLQYLGSLNYNRVINGGKIAYYMNANSTCIGNVVESSISQGIFLSTPSFGNTIMYNQLLNTL